MFKHFLEADSLEKICFNISTEKPISSLSTFISMAALILTHMFHVRASCIEGFSSRKLRLHTKLI